MFHKITDKEGKYKSVNITNSNNHQRYRSKRNEDLIKVDNKFLYKILSCVEIPYIKISPREPVEATDKMFQKILKRLNQRGDNNVQISNILSSSH